MSQKNIPHSIFQRLLNLAKSNKVDFNLLLSRYGMERFLYRLSVSPYCDRFILKGASLFLVWKGQNYRVTRDADFLTLILRSRYNGMRLLKNQSQTFLLAI